MVGDRFYDIDVATKAGIPSIGCAYGYGKPEELDAATVVVQQPNEIPAACRRLIENTEIAK